MKVKIKEFDVAMELKNNGIELEIRDTHDKFLGDLIINKTSVIWCEGKTARPNGKKMKLTDLINYMKDL